MADRLKQLVLALVAKRVSMTHLVVAGFTSGQIMRVLLELQAEGMLVQVDGKTSLSEAGAAKLDSSNFTGPKDQWIVPLAEERVPAISPAQIWLPSEFDVFD